MAVDWDALVHGPVAATFGEPVLYAPAAGGTFSISGIFDEAYTEVQVLDGVPVSSVKPVMGVRLAQFPAPPEPDDTLTIERTGTTYVVANVNPDGHGWAKLMLNWVSG